MANDFNITSEGQLIEYTGNGKDVAIPDGVKSIGEYTFSYCNSLKSVIIPQSVTSIGEEAFSACENLTSVIIPESVTSVGGGAFLDTPWLNNQQGVVKAGKVVIAYQGIDKEIVIPEGVTSIGEWAFCDCDNLQRVTIPEGVTIIGNGAFSGCNSLTDVSIPEGVTSIEASSFCDCSCLVTVRIPESVTSIGNNAFSGCSMLTNIAIPDSVNNIGANAFNKTHWLYSKEGIVKAGKVVIAYQGIDKEIVIPEGVTSIGERAFCDCNSLQRVLIPEGVTSIGACAFSDCKCLTDVLISEGVTSIGQYAFSGCGKLQRVTIPESVTSIGESVFSGCKSLTDVSIPEGVTSIGQYAFSGCGNLQNVIIPEGVERIGNHAFRNCISLRSLMIPESVTYIGESTFSGCSSLTRVVIPDGVTWIGDRAFSDCSSLTNVILTGSMMNIGEWAFSNCRSLNSITISDNVISIGRGAFSGCCSLTSIAIPDSVTNLGEGVFSGCKSLEDITFLGSKCKLGKVPFGSVLYSGRIPNGLKDKIFTLIPRFTDGTLREYILETDLWGTLTVAQQAEVFLSRQSKTLTTGYMKCITDDRLESLENAFEVCLRKKPSAKECTAVASYMTWFKEKIPARRLQKLYSLLEPVKSAEKALTIIDDDLVLKEKLGMELKADENLAPAECLVMERLVSEKKSQKDLENQLKELYGITFTDLPSILDKDGNEIEPYVFAWLLQAHESMEEPLPGAKKKITIVYKRNDTCEEAKEVLKEVDEESFQVALLELSKRFLAKHVNTKKKYLCYPISRYANEDVLSELTKEAAKWRTGSSGIDAPPLLQLRIGCMYNNTRAAMLFADRYHDLDKYAKLRGTDADTLRNTVLSEFDLDENGKKRYDLGNTILEAALQDDLTISLYDLGAQKTVKSVPKKNADPEKYETAKKDLADIRKNIKKVAKSRSNALFEDFLNGKEYESENWKKLHFSNPLINRIGRLLVWAQEDSTFTLSAEGPIDSSGTAYTISSKPIRLAYPMEMAKADVDAWQKYYTSHGIKQPFAQVWEPVIDPTSVREDRYSGIVLPLIIFNGRDKHGIIGSGFRAFSDDFKVAFKDCDLELDPSTWRLDIWDVELGYNQYTYTLGKFSYKKYTRYTNHIVGILDGWTVEQRILKDDISVVERLDSFTLAQITEFINQASEHNCNNVTAALLEYKNEHFADYNPMASFWLEDF